MECQCSKETLPVPVFNEFISFSWRACKMPVAATWTTTYLYSPAPLKIYVFYRWQALLFTRPFYWPLSGFENGYLPKGVLVFKESNLWKLCSFPPWRSGLLRHILFAFLPFSYCKIRSTYKTVRRVRHPFAFWNPDPSRETKRQIRKW